MSTSLILQPTQMRSRRDMPSIDARQSQGYLWHSERVSGAGRSLRLAGCVGTGVAPPPWWRPTGRRPDQTYATCQPGWRPSNMSYGARSVWCYALLPGIAYHTLRASYSTSPVRCTRCVVHTPGCTHRNICLCKACPAVGRYLL